MDRLNVGTDGCTHVIECHKLLFEACKHAALYLDWQDINIRIKSVVLRIFIKLKKFQISQNFFDDSNVSIASYVHEFWIKKIFKNYEKLEKRQ